jgi:hypothetical protein
MRIDLREYLEKSFVEKPGIDDQDGVPVLERDWALAPQRHGGTVDAIDPDQMFGVGRTQGAFEARHEFLVWRQRSECVGRTALRLVEHDALAIGQDQLERAPTLAHGLHLLPDGPCEMRDETGQQVREQRGACPILHGHRREVIVANRTWALLASTRVNGVVTEAQRGALIDELVRAQRDDGGWSLLAMGPWRWSKSAPPVKSPGDLDASLLSQSDGYATGLVVYTLMQAGVAPSQAAIRKGISWLETNQRAIPGYGVPGRAWRAHSLNYDREHGGEKGEPWRRLFMSDTATAFAILALADSEQRIPSSTDR